MRRLRTAALSLAMVVWGIAGALAESAAELSAADRTAIRQVVEAQLQAFQRDDGSEAFSYASPNIQRIFQTPEYFMRMVQSAYQPVYRPREVQFREIIDLEGRTTQQVLLVGPDNVPVIALYFMQRQSDGSWRIDGCTLVKSADAAA